MFLRNLTLLLKITMWAFMNFLQEILSESLLIQLSRRLFFVVATCPSLLTLDICWPQQ